MNTAASSRSTPPSNVTPMNSARLRSEQQTTLSTPRRSYGFWATLLFSGMDLIYGRKRTLSKFKVLEIIARVPYQSWENVAYVAITHRHNKHRFARRVFDFVQESRSQQDNEQWHLLILEDLIQKKNIQEGLIRYRLLPQLIALFYYHLSWLLYVIQPALSYRLNADFEDHAEHEYMQFVQENPAFETDPFVSAYARDYGQFASLADLLRNIGVDERQHKQESEVRMLQPRFA
jgi:hypothetical protein